MGRGRAGARGGRGQREDQDAAGRFGAEGAFDPAGTRAALAGLDAPALLVGGGCDLQLPPGPAAGYAGLFRRAELAVLPGGGHFPWLDDPDWFVRTVAAFLRGPAG